MLERLDSFEHVFRYKRFRIRLICSIDSPLRERRLVLDDVCASTQRIADEVPDWLIEAEACKVAFDQQAAYT